MARSQFSIACFRAIMLAYIVGSFTYFAQAQSETRRWPYEATMDVFEVHSDFPLKDLAILEETLLHLRSDIRELLNLPLNQSVIHVVLFGDASDYSRYMQHYFPSIIQRRALYLQDRGPGMLFTHWHDDIATDLRHEAAHALLNQSGVQLPLWLDEGLAEYFEIPRGSRYANCSYLPEVSKRASRGLVPSLMELEKLEQIEEFTEAHYRDSWSWIHLLLHRRHQTRQLLIDYITKARNKTPQPPMHRQLVEILEDPFLEYQSHFVGLTESATHANSN